MLLLLKYIVKWQNEGGAGAKKILELESKIL